MFAGDKVGFHVEMAENEKKRLSVDRIVYSFANRNFTMVRKPDGKNQYGLEVVPNEDFRFQEDGGPCVGLARSGQVLRIPDEVNARYQNAGFFVRPATSI